MSAAQDGVTIVHHKPIAPAGQERVGNSKVGVQLLIINGSDINDHLLLPRDSQNNPKVVYKPNQEKVGEDGSLLTSPSDDKYAYIIFFDVYNTTSFTNAKNTVADIKEKHEALAIGLIGITGDSTCSRAIPAETAQEFTTGNSVIYKEAKDKDTGFEAIFPGLDDKCYPACAHELQIRATQDSKFRKQSFIKNKWVQYGLVPLLVISGLVMIIAAGFGLVHGEGTLSTTLGKLGIKWLAIAFIMAGILDVLHGIYLSTCNWSAELRKILEKYPTVKYIVLMINITLAVALFVACAFLLTTGGGSGFGLGGMYIAVKWMKIACAYVGVSSLLGAGAAGYMGDFFHNTQEKLNACCGASSELNENEQLASQPKQ